MKLSHVRDNTFIYLKFLDNVNVKKNTSQVHKIDHYFFN